ncbi:MAG: NAD(P)H-hydrate dehydratase [Moraxellaceae bacterium]|nr:NAD(P)H-hydrate dehydratase [Moraxellaceae bacterium]
MSYPIYSSQQIKQLEQQVFASGVASQDLMYKAGEAVFSILQQQYPLATKIVVLCGAGNNGGDGYVVACLAQQAGYQVQVFYSAEPKTVDAQIMYNKAQALAVNMQVWQGRTIQADVIVDALFGIGLNAAIIGISKDMIAAANDNGVPIIAIDVPSGINADTGAVMTIAIQAQVTVCFIAYKLGLLTGAGSQFAGKVIIQTLGIPQKYYTLPNLANYYLQQQLTFPQRAKNSHKGDFGHVLVIGGDEGMGGAAMMTAEATLRAGAGRVTVATHPNHVAPLLARCPEVMAQGILHPEQLQPLLANATVIVIGMGLGRQAWGQRLWLAVKDCTLPMIVDADALYWLAQQPQQKANWVLTPHAGEAGRLLQRTSDMIENDRLTSVQQLQQKYGGVALLKGAGSLIAGAELVNLCPYGNAGMATAGMGDTLAGIMAGLVAQFGLNVDIVTKAVVAHALAGDMAAQSGQRGLLATDLLVPLRVLLNS